MKIAFKAYLIASIVFMCIPVIMYAHATMDFVPGTEVTPINIAVPTWLQTLISFIIVVAPAIQFVLKRVPTPYSVKIGGWLGKLLDIVTFFQPDKKDNGGNHN